MKIFTVAIILFVIIFLPIPVSIRFIYKDSKLKLYIMGIKINIKKLYCRFQQKKNKKKPSASKKTSLGFNAIMFLLNKIDCISFKPRFRLYYNSSFGLGDAYYTGLAYGYIHAVLLFVFKLLSIPFKLEVPKAEIKPEFNKLCFSILLKSIIFFNIAQIIYMAVVIFKNLKYIKNKKKQ